MSAVVEMANKVDAKRAFNLIAYSLLHGSEQPLYLEWAARQEELGPSAISSEADSLRRRKRRSGRRLRKKRIAPSSSFATFHSRPH